MDKILRLDRATRRRLINQGRKTKDPHTALRFLMIAKLGQGFSRQQVARDLACAPSTVVRAARRFAEFGKDGLLDQRAFNGLTKADERFREELSGVLLSVPTEFGWQRPTWTRELLCLELERRGLPRVAACDEWAKVTEQVVAEPNDRATVVVGGAIVDVILEAMLLSWLLPERSVETLFDPLQNGSLSTFGAKKNLAFALALVTEDEKHDLRAVAAVRNTFAHHLLDATFDYPDVRKALDGLRTFPAAEGRRDGRGSSGR